MRHIITGLLLALVAVAAYGQADTTSVKGENQRSAAEKKAKASTIYVYGLVSDNFTKAGIPDLKGALLRQDSTVVDTLEVYESQSYASGIGKTASATRYYFEVSREPAQYILRFTHPDYDTTYVSFEMKQVGRRREYLEGPSAYMKRARRNAYGDMDGGTLGEVTVKATRVQMVWKGDTLVYNADAFNVPEGSMLDGLIKQLPGVELKDNGEIFVGGKKIDNLTLNGKDFFKGKNKVMLENLPYFTVKNIEVYKKQTEENKYLGIDDEDKKEYTMDVILRREYNRGGSANIEAGGSPGPADGGDWRYKLKGFGLYFTDRTRAVLFGGLNNINETMDYDEYEQEYKDRTRQAGDNHFRQVGGQFTYLGPEDKVNNSTEVKASWSDNRSESRSESETFLSGASTFGRSAGTTRYKASSFELGNTLRASGKLHLYSSASLRYSHSTSEGEGWNLTTADAVMKDSINSSWYRSRSKSSHMSANAFAYISKQLKSGDGITLNLQGNYSRQFRPESTSQNHYVYHKLGTTDMRDRLTKSPNYSYNWNAALSYNYNLTKGLRLSPSLAIGTGDNHSDRHEYLRDEADYLFDAQNSYNQRTQTLDRRVGMNISFNKDFKPSTGSRYLGMYGQVSTDFQRQKMGYESQPLTTDLTRNYSLWSSYVYLYYNREDSILDREFNMGYNLSQSTPSVTDLIDRPITSDPLNIFLGNPDLKLSTNNNFWASYTLTRDSIDQTIRLNLNAGLTHNARVQGYTYDPTTGIRTYRPENIGGGNWSAGGSVNWSRAVDKKKLWHITNEVSLNYNKSTGLALVLSAMSSPSTGEPEGDALSRVGTLTVGYKPSIRFQKGKLTLTAKGDISYRHIHRNMSPSSSGEGSGEGASQPTDIWDIGYGFNAGHKLPWDFQLDTDLTIHSRRGYTDDEMKQSSTTGGKVNDNRIYWDASLTKSFKQGKWLLKLRGYDLLGQVSSISYSINAQGRTETWTNSMRRYAMLTVAYRLTQKPQKAEE